MNPQLVAPFINSIQNVCWTMMQLPVTVEEPCEGLAEPRGDTLCGTIEFTGEISGEATLRVPIETGLALVALLTGEQPGEHHPDFADALGELANMIAGAAKAGMGADELSISCPTVCRDTERPGLAEAGVDRITIPCSCDRGEFAVELSLRDERNSDARAA